MPTASSPFQDTFSGGGGSVLAFRPPNKARGGLKVALFFGGAWVPGRDMVARLPELEVRRLWAAGVRVDGVAPLCRSDASDAVPASALQPRQSASLALGWQSLAPSGHGTARRVPSMP